MNVACECRQVQCTERGLVDSKTGRASASSFRRLSSDRDWPTCRPCGRAGGGRERLTDGARHGLKTVMFRKTAWCIGIRNPRENDFLCLLRSEISSVRGHDGQRDNPWQ